MQKQNSRQKNEKFNILPRYYSIPILAKYIIAKYSMGFILLNIQTPMLATLKKHPAGHAGSVLI
jgi:hypothetical protein